MIWPSARNVVLVSDDVRCLNLVAAELHGMGCRVFCVRDLEQAAQVVRAKLTTRFVLILLGDDIVSPTDLCVAMRPILPRLDGWL